jgi:hypothetical protein
MFLVGVFFEPCLDVGAAIADDVGAKGDGPGERGSAVPALVDSVRLEAQQCSEFGGGE